MLREAKKWMQLKCSLTWEWAVTTGVINLRVKVWPVLQHGQPWWHHAKRNKSATKRKKICGHTYRGDMEQPRTGRWREEVVSRISRKGKWVLFNELEVSVLLVGMFRRMSEWSNRMLSFTINLKINTFYHKDPATPLLGICLFNLIIPVWNGA